jgi:hypothetical protein
MKSEEEQKKAIEELVNVLRRSCLSPSAKMLGLLGMKNMLEQFLVPMMKHYSSLVRLIRESVKDTKEAEALVSKLRTQLLELLGQEMEGIDESIVQDLAEKKPDLTSSFVTCCTDMVARVTALTNEGVDMHAAVIQATDECVKDPKIRDNLLAKLHMLALATAADDNLLRNLLSTADSEDESDGTD